MSDDVAPDGVVPDDVVPDDVVPDDVVPLSELSPALQAHGDVAAMTEVLTTSLAGLPTDVVTVERRRSAADRLRGRPGTPVALVFDAGERRLALRSDEHGRPVATVDHVVRGVRLSHHRIDVDDWLAELAMQLRRLAASDERSRDVLYRFLLG